MTSPSRPIRYFAAAVHLAGELCHAIDGTLARRLDLRLSLSRDEDLELACELADGLDSDLERAHALAHNLNELYRTRARSLNAYQAREQIFDIDRSISSTLDLALQRASALDRVCAQGVAGRLGILPTEGLAEAILDGAMDDFTSADLTYARLADADLIGVRWSLSGTIWPPETDVKALLARSEAVDPGGGVLVVKRRGMAWPPVQLADRLKPANSAHPTSMQPLGSVRIASIVGKSGRPTGDIRVRVVSKAILCCSRKAGKARSHRV